MATQLGKMILEAFTTRMPVVVNENTCGRKTYVVTGANIGLGLETARHLVAASAKTVVLAVRNLEKGEAAKVDIEKTTGCTGVVRVRHLDLSTFASAQDFAKKISEELDVIDGFVCNAGAYHDQWELFEGVHQSSMFVNVTNTMFLAALMMPKLRESARKTGTNTRICFVASPLGYASKGELDKCLDGNVFDGFNDEKRTELDLRYGLTKLVLEFAVREFAQHFPVQETNVIVAFPSPGLCATGLARDAKTSTQVIHETLRFFLARSAESGSRAILYGLVVGEEGHGKLLSGCEIKDYWVPAWMNDEEGVRVQKKIWAELVEILEKVQPGLGLRE